MHVIADAFLSTRADHLPADLFNQFIVPPFFQRISIFADKKSVRILGGRGCGKTMFIRYFCHGTTFSQSRSDISDEDLAAVGLYFRPDTGFCSLMTAKWLGEQQAGLAFSHYVALNLLAEACQAFRSIERARLTAGRLEVTDALLGPGLATLLDLKTPTIQALESAVQRGLAELELWVRNPRRDAPTFVSFSSVLPLLATDVAMFSPRLARLAFRAFIDEFENLQERHREIVCDAIKHPHERMTIHIAHKRDAVTDFKTSSQERVVETHDLRTIDLEKQLANQNDFELLAAELFLMRLHEAKAKFNCALFKPEWLHDPQYLNYRLSEKYRKDVLRCVREILPMISAPDIANRVVNDPALRRRLTEMLRKGLERQGLAKTVSAESLISERHPAASIVLGALLNRTTQDGADLLEQYKQSVEVSTSDGDPFFKVGGWIDNNLYGCLFHLYAGLPRRPNILYAGFERFCQIASPNLRFFQELCHTTLLLAFHRQSSDSLDEQPRVDPEKQALAAKQVSDSLFEDILQLGHCGTQLLEVARRLGLIFEAFNRRRSQSEPEINHFSIDRADEQGLSAGAQELLREAKIWSVLYEEKDTKNKSDYDVAQSDLVLNPIYAPHFNISYRKRRKIALKATEVDILLCQSSAQFEILLKRLVEPDGPYGDGKSSEQLF